MAPNAREACVEQQAEGRGEESSARGSNPIKKSAGATSSQIQQRKLFFPFVTSQGWASVNLLAVTH